MVVGDGQFYYGFGGYWVFDLQSPNDQFDKILLSQFAGSRFGRAPPEGYAEKVGQELLRWHQHPVPFALAHLTWNHKYPYPRES